MRTRQPGGVGTATATITVIPLPGRNRRARLRRTGSGVLPAAGRSDAALPVAGAAVREVRKAAKSNAAEATGRPGRQVQRGRGRRPAPPCGGPRAAPQLHIPFSEFRSECAVVVVCRPLCNIWPLCGATGCPVVARRARGQVRGRRDGGLRGQAGGRRDGGRRARWGAGVTAGGGPGGGRRGLGAGVAASGEASRLAWRRGRWRPGIRAGVPATGPGHGPLRRSQKVGLPRFVSALYPCAESGTTGSPLSTSGVTRPSSSNRQEVEVRFTGSNSPGCPVMVCPS
jgi:hypothetical protein